MNKHREPPPPYEEEASVESTPLLQRSSRRTVRRPRLVAFAALLVTYLFAGFILLYLFNSAAKQKEPEVPEVPVRVAVIGTNSLLRLPSSNSANGF